MHTLKNNMVYVAWWHSSSDYGALVRVTPEPPLRLTPCDSPQAIRALVYGIWPDAITIPYADIMRPVSKLPARVKSLRDDLRGRTARRQGVR